MTSHLTFLALQAAQALAALLFTGFGLPLESKPALFVSRFFDPESWEEAGDCDSVLPLLPFGSKDVCFSALLMMRVAGILLCIVLYWFVLFCIVLYCFVLFCFVRSVVSDR